ncbi:MAG: sugar ABC transporter permease, partial [Anaerolineae bacterium]|nr:sugar ABC transporter permease [Anaerolineae bacterium]
MATLPRFSKWLTTRRGRTLRENFTAYLFLFPALLLVFIFGIYPVGFAFFVSLHRWRRFPGEYLGLSNYEQALGSLAYVLFFWLSVGIFVFGLSLVWRMWTQKTERVHAFSGLIPGALNGAATLLLINWIVILIPIILDIPNRVRGQERVPGLFTGELAASFQYPEAATAGSQFLLVGIAALVVSIVWLRIVRSETGGKFLFWGTASIVAAGVGTLLMQLTLSEIAAATAAAQESGEALPIWSQIIFISAGVALLIAAYIIWQRAVKQEGDRRFVTMALAAAVLVVGGYALAVELPRALAEADREVLSGFNITVMFALGTVPFQLSIGLGLAYLLFQNIKAK